MSNNFLFVDIETSGLDPNTDEIWEVYFTKVTEDFLPHSEYHALGKPKKALDDYDAWIQKTHGGNTLYVAATTRGKNWGDVDQDLYDYISSCGDKPILSGSSVHFDRDFLYANFSWLKDKCHYRLLDMTALRLISGHHPLLPFSDTSHRAKPDCLNAVYTARYYQQCLTKRS